MESQPAPNDLFKIFQKESVFLAAKARLGGFSVKQLMTSAFQKKEKTKVFDKRWECFSSAQLEGTLFKMGVQCVQWSSDIVTTR